MATIFEHHGKLWLRIKRDGKWTKKRTEYRPGQEELALAYGAEAEVLLARRATMTTNGEPRPDDPFDLYATWWLRMRGEQGIASAPDDRGRYVHHVRAHLGDIPLNKITPANIRDMVRAHRALVRKGKLAPRTARHIYAVVRTMLRDAVVEQRIAVSPAAKEHLGRHELPPIVDKDGEWRSEATYELAEVRRLISDGNIPADRRVQYALKALAGLRHSDMCVVHWRNYKRDKEPLGMLVVVTPKTGVTRQVPVHPLLAKILAVWKLTHWERTYGRPATDDDLIVPTRAFTAPDGRQTCAAFQRDLVTLGLRQKAGSLRNRGGHDLRSWFITTTQSDGAHRDILATITHTKRTDVMDGYSRSSWAMKCAEVAKLRITLPDDAILPVVTRLVTTDASARVRWAFRGRRMDRRSIQTTDAARSGAMNSDTCADPAGQSGPERADLVTSLATSIAEAVLAGDEVTARRLALEIRAGVTPERAGASGPAAARPEAK